MVVASPFPANHGTPAAIREMAEALAQRGHSIHIVTYHFGKGSLSATIRLHRIPNFGLRREIVVGPTLEKPFLDLLMVSTLVRVIKQERIDVIHAHNYEGAMVAYCGTRLMGKPLVYHAVNTMIDELASYNFIRPKKLATFMAKLLDYFVPRMGDRIIAISDEIVDFLAAQKVKPERIRMIPLGIDLEPFSKASKAVPSIPDVDVKRPLVLYTGILDAFQRIDYLLYAMGAVKDEIPEVQLLMVTNVAKEEDLTRSRALIKKLHLEHHVRIACNQTFHDLIPYLKMAAVTVVPRPDCPGFPVKLLNYMAAGKPTVLFQGSSKGLVHMRHTFIARDHDWEGFSRGILVLLKDQKLAGEMGENAFRWVKEKHSWKNLAPQIENIYYELLGSRKEKGGVI